MPPTTLVTEELSEVQSTLTANTREMTKASDDIGTGHEERIPNQGKMYLERILGMQMRVEQRLDGVRNKHTDQCWVSNIVLTHSLDEMATVAYQLREMCIRANCDQEET